MTYFVYDIALLLFASSCSSSSTNFVKFLDGVKFNGAFETEFNDTLAPSLWDHIVTSTAQPSTVNLLLSHIGHKATQRYRRRDDNPYSDRPPDPYAEPKTYAPSDFSTPPMPGQGFSHKFEITTTRIRRRTRTLPKRHSFLEDCDVLAFYCMKGYNTGKVCGRTSYYNYFEFKNYCQMDYVNCMERYDVWQVVHMGECFRYEAQRDQYQHYPYWDDYFLDTYYLIDDQV